MAKTTTLEKNCKAVFKRYPNAKAVQSPSGLWTVICEKDLEVIDILEELFIPYQPTSDLAWEKAAFTSKTLQNLNRSNPLKEVFKKSTNDIEKFD